MNEQIIMDEKITEEEINEANEMLDSSDLEETEYKFLPKAGDLSFYKNTFKKYPLYTQEEEKQAFKELRAGNKEKRNEICLHNLRFPWFVASKFHYALNQSIAFEDLIQEGNLGLLRSIELFDESKDVRFGTYAFFWVYQHINRYISNNATTIRIPVHAQEKLRKLRRNLINELAGCDDNVDEVMHEIITEYGVNSGEFLAFRCYTTKSLHTKIGEQNGDEDSELIDFIPDSNDTEKQVLDEIFSTELSKYLREHLSEREIVVLSKRFGLNREGTHTLEAIGNELNVSRERVRQIETKAIRKLRALSATSKFVDAVRK